MTSAPVNRERKRRSPTIRSTPSEPIFMEERGVVTGVYQTCHKATYPKRQETGILIIEACIR